MDQAPPTTEPQITPPAGTTAWGTLPHGYPAVGAGAGTGNRCGHNPRAPRLTPFRGPKNRLPSLIRRGVERIQEYYRPRQADVRARYAALDAHRRSARRRRSESREAVILLAGAMIQRMDIVTREVIFGNPSQGYAPMSLDALAREAGISRSRAARAHRILHTAGWIHVERRYEFVAGDYIGLPARRTIQPAMLRSLSIQRHWRHEYDRAIERARKRNRQQRRRQAPETDFAAATRSSAPSSPPTPKQGSQTKRSPRQPTAPQNMSREEIRKRCYEQNPNADPQTVEGIVTLYHPD